MVGIGVMELILLVGLGLFIYRWRSRRAVNPSDGGGLRNRMGLKLLGSIASSVLILFCVIAVIRSKNSMSVESPPSDLMQATVDSVSVPVSPSLMPEVPSFPKFTLSDSDSYLGRELAGDQAIPTVQGPRMTIGFLGLIVVLLLVWRFAWSRSGHVSAQELPTTMVNDNEHGLQWFVIIIPISCLVFLGLRTMEFVTPMPQPARSAGMEDFPQRYERMQKIAKEFVESHDPGSTSAPTVTDWITQNVAGDLGANRLILVSGQFSSVAEAEAELMPMVATLVKQAFHKERPWQGDWIVPSGTIRERVIENQYIDRKPRTIGNFSGDIFRLYMLVNLTPDVLHSFESEWKTRIVERRLAGISLIFAWIIGQLLIGVAYFRVTGLNSRGSRWRWKIVAILLSIGSTVAANFGFIELARRFST